MYRGKIAELAESEVLYTNPQHVYTKSLLAAIPVPDPKIESSKSRVFKEEYEDSDPYQLERSRLVEVAVGHSVSMPT